jgi:hypothetical protein
VARKSALAGMTAWPISEGAVQAIGFDPLLLDRIKDGVFNSGFLVVVGEKPKPWRHEPGDPAKVTFDWLGFRYELRGVWESGRISVESVEKIARVDVPDDEGQEGNAVVEDFRAERLAAENPTFGIW